MPTLTQTDLAELVAPALELDAADIAGAVIIGVKKDGGMQVGANLTLTSVLEVLSSAGAQVLMSAMQNGDPEAVEALLSLARDVEAGLEELGDLASKEG